MKNYWELTKVLPNDKNQEIVGEFLLSLKIANRSEGTIIQYRRFLERFFGDMNDLLTEISSNFIQQWFIKNQTQVSEATVRFQLSVLSSFFAFCVLEEYLKHSPMKKRWFPRLPKPVPKYLEKADIAKTRKQSEHTSLRNQLLVEFMLSSGCRVGEVHRLNQEDIDLENRTACVVGKGKKIRHVHFTDKCAILLERYMNNYPKAHAVFVTTTGKRLSIRAIQHIISEIGTEAGLTTRLHPHRLRHTFATELLAKGAELSFIGDELGHADIGTTQIYARLQKREIISLYRKYMG